MTMRISFVDLHNPRALLLRPNMHLSERDHKKVTARIVVHSGSLIYGPRAKSGPWNLFIWPQGYFEKI